jgi:hypothetical protein
LRAIHPARLGLSKGRNPMFNKVLRHEFVANRQVLAIEDLLEVPPHKRLVGL